MKMPYEILLRGNPDGSFSGAHVIDKPSDVPRPIKAEDWPDIAPGVNAAALAAVATVDALTAERDAARAQRDHYKADLDAVVAERDAALDRVAELEAENRPN